MIVWLNGPRGVGGTSTAAALRALVPGTRTYDPQRVETALGLAAGLLPGTRAADLHELAWRAATIAGCVVAHAAPPHRDDRLVVVPLTVLDRARLDAVLDGIRTRGLDVLHVTLHASAPELARRITRDAAGPTARARRLAQVAAYERAAPVLAGYGPVVATDRRSTEEVAAVMAGLVAGRREG